MFVFFLIICRLSQLKCNMMQVAPSMLPAFCRLLALAAFLGTGQPPKQLPDRQVARSRSTTHTSVNRPTDFSTGKTHGCAML